MSIYISVFLCINIFDLHPYHEQILCIRWGSVNSCSLSRCIYLILFQFIQSLGLLDNGQNQELVQRICAAIDVNSFEVRGPPIPAIGCAEVLRGVYLQAALLAHDCVANTHMSINDNNVLVCHASTDIKKGEVIYYNYTDSLKVTQLWLLKLWILYKLMSLCNPLRYYSPFKNHHESGHRLGMF